MHVFGGCREVNCVSMLLAIFEETGEDEQASACGFAVYTVTECGEFWESAARD